MTRGKLSKAFPTSHFFQQVILIPKLQKYRIIAYITNSTCLINFESIIFFFNFQTSFSLQSLLSLPLRLQRCCDSLSPLPPRMSQISIFVKTHGSMPSEFCHHENFRISILHCNLKPSALHCDTQISTFHDVS